MVKRADEKGHIRFANRLVAFEELSGDPCDETTDEGFAKWMDRVNEILAATGFPQVSADAEFNSDSMREMFDAAFTPEETASVVVIDKFKP